MRRLGRAASLVAGTGTGLEVEAMPGGDTPPVFDVENIARVSRVNNLI